MFLIAVQRNAAQAKHTGDGKRRDATHKICCMTLRNYDRSAVSFIFQLIATQVLSVNKVFKYMRVEIWLEIKLRK